MSDKMRYSDAMRSAISRRAPMGLRWGCPFTWEPSSSKGIHLIDHADLEALSSACEKHGRYEFLFSMAPLILERGTASPVNPLALF